MPLPSPDTTPPVTKMYFIDFLPPLSKKNETAAIKQNSTSKRTLEGASFLTYTEKSNSQNVGYGQYFDAVSTSSLSTVLRTSFVRFSTSSW